jgi:GTP-binding protein LepA
MDTPGHVDFAYEVSRSLAACEGALLVVDAAQGVEAQTLANVYQSIEHDHEIVPVINKIDLPSAEPEKVKGDRGHHRPRCLDAVLASAKIRHRHRGSAGSHRHRIPPPKGDRDQAAEGDAGRQLVRSLSRRRRPGAHHRRQIKKGQQIKFMAADTTTWSTASAPSAQDRAVARTRPRRNRLHHRADQGSRPGPRRRHDHRRQAPANEALPGFKEVQPVVFCGLFPTDAADFEKAARIHLKLRLNDASFSFEMETSAALGFGFRCGFLGLLHLEIIQERLTREYDLDLITTAPSVVYTSCCATAR